MPSNLALVGRRAKIPAMHKLALLLIPALALGACSKDGKKKADPEHNLGSGTTPHAKPGDPKANVIATLSIDWEGAYLSDAGLEALADFRKTWEHAPITHFVCPAYFLQSSDKAEAAATVQSHIREGDEVGLHIHSWKSLAERAGVPFRSSPNFYADKTELIAFDQNDRGYEVSLSAYGPQELAKLVQSSLALLEENGLGKATSFRAGGYVTSPALLEAVRSAGMHVDSSSSWSPWYKEGQGNFQKELARLWPRLQELTQPYGIDTSAGAIIEVPNTGSFVEYVSTDQMIGHLERAAALSRSTGAPVYVNFGAHQETADEFIYLLSDAWESRPSWQLAI
ncbi:MAG: hypothetical protein GY811_25140 [Myxococcales bacterium]|nr:hypothetical protein [Myxococcales bacterium]